MDLLLGRACFHIAGYAYKTAVPIPLCGSRGVDPTPWKADALVIDGLCGNCARIAHIDGDA
jgi:hypothetical protein